MCEAATSETVEPARSAMRRWVAGGMTRSSGPTTAQLGIVFQAIAPVPAVFASLSTPCRRFGGANLKVVLEVSGDVGGGHRGLIALDHGAVAADEELGEVPLDLVGAV